MPVFAPDDLIQAIQKRPGETFAISVLRDGKVLILNVTPEAVKEKAPTGEETQIGRIYAQIVTQAVRFEPYDPLVAAAYGWVKTWDMTLLTAKGLWKIVSRQIDSSNIGGPIQIAAEAGRQAKEGVASLAVFKIGRASCRERV